MSLQSFAKQTQRYTTENLPTILTIVGVVGTGATAFLTGKASFKAAEILRDAKIEKALSSNDDVVDPPKLTKGEVFKLVWLSYLPAAGAGAVTVSSIVFAHRINTKRAAALVAAYTASERAYSEYKDKVLEKVGKNKEQVVRDEIAQDKTSRTHVNEEHIYVTKGGNTLCIDAYSGRPFRSSMEALKKVQNDLNYKIINGRDCVSLSEFYSEVGLPKTKHSDDVGWNDENLIDLYIPTTMSETDEPALLVDFATSPVPNFYRSHS